MLLECDFLIELAITLNNHTTDLFVLEHGVRGGGKLNDRLFAIVGQVLDERVALEAYVHVVLGVLTLKLFLFDEL